MATSNHLRPAGESPRLGRGRSTFNFGRTGGWRLAVSVGLTAALGASAAGHRPEARPGPAADVVTHQVSSSPATAADPFATIQSTTDDPSDPFDWTELENWLGGPLGHRAIEVDEMETMLRNLAESPRARLVEYTTSHEGRTLFALEISRPERIAAIDAVQTRAAAVANGDPSIDPNALADAPGVAWIGACIHGDELSGTDAAIALAFRLVKSDEPEVLAWLDDLVIIVDPLQNPDGRARYLAQIRALRGATPNPDPAALHHAGDWSSGRGNHYLFDLNRDWVSMVHPETRGRVEQYLKWMPHLVVDAHEMGSSETFLFDPPRDPINPSLSPNVLRRRIAFGAVQAAAFDARNWAYYTKEWYEEWYPGYTNAWASLGGSIGLLFEQAAYNGSDMTLPDGRVETYADAVERQLVGMVACLGALHADRAAIVRERFDEARAARDPGSALPRGVLLIRPTSDPTRNEAFAELLKAQGIVVEQANGTFVATNARGIGGDELPQLACTADTLIIRSAQPRRRVLHALCDFDPRMTDAFLLEERTRVGRGDGSMLYDVTAWNLPMAHGLDAWWADSIDPVATRTWIESDAPDHEVTDAAAGWIVDGRHDDVTRVLIAATTAGHSVRVATRPFVLGDRRHPAGSLLFRRGEQVENFAAWLTTALDGRHVEVTNANAGLTGNGVDLGGQRFPLVRHPRVAIVGQWPISTTGFGGLWHALDVRLGLPASPVPATGLGSLDLRRYDVLVLPPSGRLDAAISSAARDRIEAWVREGGTLIAVGSSVDWAMDAGLSSLVRRRDVLPELETWQAAIDRERADRTPTIDPEAIWGGRPADAEVAAADRATAAADQAAADAARAERVQSVVERMARERPQVGSQPDRGRRPDRVAPGREPGVAVMAEAILANQSIASPPAEAPFGDAARLPDDPDERARADADAARFSPTGIFARAEVDAEHWLAFGLPAGPRPVLVAGSAVHLSRRPTQTPVRLGPAEGLRLSGLLWPEARERMHRATWAGVDRVGRGQVIAFPHDPVFRGATESTRRFFENAVLLGPSLGVDVPAP